MEISDGLIILISVIVTGMVPWGFMMHGRLAAIEVAVQETTLLRNQILTLSETVHDLEVRFAKIENGS